MGDVVNVSSVFGLFSVPGQAAYNSAKFAVRGFTEALRQDLAARDGFTPEQRFFIGFAQWTCENEREPSKRLNAVTNPHSPGIWRINGVVVNMPASFLSLASRRVFRAVMR